MAEITKSQYVYGLSNPSFETKQKIGWSREYPSIRACNLFTSGVPTPFKVEFIISTNDGAKLESNIHEHLKQYRVANNREFFEIPMDDLAKLLTNELQLKLDYNILDIKPLIVKNKQIQELNEIYHTLKREANEFINKLKKHKTKLNIKEVEDKVYVSVYHYNNEEFKLEYGDREEINCLTTINCWIDEGPYVKIKNCCHFLEEDIKQYEGYIRNINENYESIKENIGIKGIRSDNKRLKEWMLYTHDKLNNILKKYEWDF
jgi:hypothetical protein